MDELGDLTAGAFRFLGELSDFLGDNGEPSARLSCTRRFDGCIERKQIRLSGDVRYHLDDMGNLLRVFGEGIDGCLYDLCAVFDLRHVSDDLLHR